MRTYRIYTIWAVLIVFQMMFAGCKPIQKVQAELFVLSEHIQVDKPLEITIEPSTGCLFEVYGQGDQLIGNSRLDEDVKFAVIDIETQQAQRMALNANVADEPLMHYFIDMRKPDLSSSRAELWGCDAINNQWEQIIVGQIDHPAIFENIVVWEEYRDNQRNIYGYDLADKQYFSVAQGPGLRLFPKISGDWVVYLLWQPDIQYRFELHAYNMVDKEDMLVGYMPTTETANYPSYWLFDIDQNLVVWRTIGKEIHVYDLASKVERSIFKGEATDIVGRIDISGDLVVWNNGPQDKRGYDLSYNNTFDVPYLPDSASENTSTWSVILTHNYIVWLVNEESKPDWALGTPLAPGVSTPSNPDPLMEKQRCDQRVFVARIIRK